MKNLTALILVLITAVSHAQYQPTALEGRRWNQHFRPTWSLTSMYYQEFKGDTLFKGKTMSKFLSVDASGNPLSLDAIVYEDQSTPALTFYYPKPHGLFGDSVYLNLGLAVGDSSAFKCNNDTGYYRLDSTSTIIVSNTQRKEYHLTAKVKTTGYGRRRTYFSWIEGLGNLQGAGMETILPPMCISDYGYFEVICIFDSLSTQLYQNPNYSICDGVSLSETDYPQISLFPNPASTFVDIENSILTEVKTIQIVNSAGLLVKEISNPTSGRIDIRELPIGLYSINVIFQQNMGAMDKLVIAR